MIYACVCVCVCVWACTYIHTYIHTHIVRVYVYRKTAVKPTVKEIKLNIMCLKTFYNFKQKDLIAYSAARVKFPDENIIRQYRDLLRRIEQKELVIGKMVSVLDSVLHDAHVFRSGTKTKSAERLEAERIKSVKVCT